MGVKGVAQLVTMALPNQDCIAACYQGYECVHKACKSKVTIIKHGIRMR